MSYLKELRQGLRTERVRQDYRDLGAACASLGRPCAVVVLPLVIAGSSDRAGVRHSY
jgi:hypothetical protein